MMMMIDHFYHKIELRFLLFDDNVQLLEVFQLMSYHDNHRTFQKTKVKGLLILSSVSLCLSGKLSHKRLSFPCKSARRHLNRYKIRYLTHSSLKKVIGKSVAQVFFSSDRLHNMYPYILFSTVLQSRDDLEIFQNTLYTEH